MDAAVAGAPETPEFIPPYSAPLVTGAGWPAHLKPRNSFRGVRHVPPSADFSPLLRGSAPRQSSDAMFREVVNQRLRLEAKARRHGSEGGDIVQPGVE